MNPYTPQQQAENMLAGLKHTYQVVAKRHVHPWYTWAILAAAIGFTVGVAYVANQDAEFSSSRAATAQKMQEVITALDQEVPDVPYEPTEAPAAQVIQAFVSDGSEKVAVFIPTISKIEDEDSKFLLIVGVALAIAGVPGPLDFVGVLAGEFVGAAIGASGTFFNTIITGLVEEGVNHVITENVPMLYPGGEIASRVGGVISGGEAGGVIAGSFKRMADDAVKVTADEAIKAIRAEAKLVRVKYKAEFARGNYFGPVSGAAMDLPEVVKTAQTSIRKSQKKYNPVSAQNKIGLISNSAITVLRGMRNPKSKYGAGDYAQEHRYEAMKYMKEVANNKQGTITTATANAFAVRRGDHYLEYDRMNRPTVILPGTKKPWPATLPGSQWVGFRPNLDIPGKGPRKYTIMNVVKKVEVSGAPTEGILQFMTTNKQTDVVINGVKIYSISPKNNRVIEPTTAIALDISDYLLPGTNRIAIYTVQAGDVGQRFGVNFAGYIASTSQ